MTCNYIRKSVATAGIGTLIAGVVTATPDAQAPPQSVPRVVTLAALTLPLPGAASPPGGPDVAGADADGVPVALAVVGGDPQPVTANSTWDPYYTPIEAKLPRLREQYGNDPEALEVIELHQKEIDLYRRYSDWYGYAFFVMRIWDSVVEDQDSFELTEAQ